MSRILISSALAMLLTAGIVFGLAGQVGAQSQLPIFFDEDDIVASVVVGEDVVVTHHAYQAELEALTQQVATVSPLAAVLAQLPPASSTNSVRFEGGQPIGSVANSLSALGYNMETLVPPALPSADIAAVRTQ